MIDELTKHIYEIERKNGEAPIFIPLTRDEIFSIMKNPDHAYRPDPRARVQQFMGIPAVEHPFATEIRARQVELPIVRLSQEYSMSDIRLNIERREFRDESRNRTIEQLIAHILGNTEELTLTHEWDMFAGIKRKLLTWKFTDWLLTKLGVRDRFRINCRTVKIRGQVLYPYLNVQFPHHQHVVKFSVL